MVPYSERELGGPVVLKRQLGLWSCIAMTISPIIGSGIFISPKGILANVDGSIGWCLIIWVACGAIAVIGALSMAELSTMIRKSGGLFVYILTAYNTCLAFIVVFLFLIAIRPAVNVIISLTMARYLLTPFVSSDCVEIPSSAITMLAIFVLTLIVLLNIYSVKWSYRLEIVLTTVKLLGLTMIIIIGLSRLYQGHTYHFQDAFSASVDPARVSLAFYAGMFAYSGWQMIPIVIEEIERPGRNIPIAIMVSLSVVTVVYLLTNIAYFTALSPNQLLASPAVASDFARITIGEWAWLIQLLVGISCLSSRITATFASARIAFVSAREGLVPELFAMISIRRLTPLPAIMLLHLLTLVTMSFNDIYALISYLGFSNWMFTAIAISIIPYYRWKYPKMKRPYKVPLVFPILYIGVALFVTCCSLYSAPRECGIGLALMLLAVPIYLFFVYWKSKPTWCTNTTTNVTHFFQKLLVVIRQEQQTY